MWVFKADVSTFELYLKYLTIPSIISVSLGVISQPSEMDNWCRPREVGVIKAQGQG